MADDLLIVQTAWEWFQASGPKTLERLREILEHQASAYGLGVQATPEVWAQAWDQAQARFVARYGAAAPPTLPTLAADLATLEARDQAQRTREQCELALRGKLAPKRAQDAPTGLFAQHQEELFT